MKRSLTIFAQMAIVFLLGWLGHVAYSYDPQSGLQWQFVFAAQRGDERSLERYFQQGARIDDRPTAEGGALSGFPALLEASEAGQPTTVEWLLAHGANPNLQSSDSWPLAAAERRVAKATKTVEILKKYGAKNLHPQ